MHYVFPFITWILANFASQPTGVETCKEFRVEWESVVFFGVSENVGEVRGEKEERAEGWWRLACCGGVVVLCCGVVWCGVVVCVCMLRKIFLSRVGTQPVLFLFVPPA